MAQQCFGSAILDRLDGRDRQYLRLRLTCNHPITQAYKAKGTLGRLDTRYKILYGGFARWAIRARKP